MKYTFQTCTLFSFLFFFLISFGQTTETFNFTGAPVFWEVPPCVDTIDVVIAGGRGGGNLGGNGAVLSGKLPVVAGQILELRVGGQGGCPAAGWNGGGASFNGQGPSCGGGGASDIRVAPYALNNRIIVAAGGGGQGGGNPNQQFGGTGGCATGAAGQNTYGSGATGGTQTTGGNGGTPYASPGTFGQAGSLGQGGNGGQDNCVSNSHGGGGGGGFFGGGGGGPDCISFNNFVGGGGGGGGSSLVPAGFNCAAGSNNGQGYIQITYQGAAVGDYEYVLVNPTCVGVDDGSIAIWYQDDIPDSLVFSFDGGITWGQDTIISGLGIGTYDVCIRIYIDTIFCEICDEIDLEAGPPIPITISGDTTVCQNGTATLVAQASQGTTFTYFWSHTNNNSGTQLVSPVNQTTYSVSAINEIGCTSDTVQVTVSLHPPLNGSIQPTIETCPGDSVLLVGSASGGIGAPYGYTWSSGGNLVSSGDSVYVTPTTTTVYNLTITDGCESSPFLVQITHLVSVLPPIQISVDEREKCIPGTFTFTLDMDPNLFNNFTWNFSTGEVVQNESGFQITVNQLGSFDVFFEYITTNNCYFSGNFPDFYVVYDVPKADFTWLPNPPDMLNTTVFFQNGSQGADNYLWFINGGAPSFSTDFEVWSTFPLGEVGQYPVTLVAYTEDNCADTITKIVDIVAIPTLYVPNTFTPDGDEFNENWRVYINGIDTYDFNLVLYNRWGEIIWESKDPEATWDGTYKGFKVPVGTYVWTIQAGSLYTDENYTWNGFVSVVY
jgi:gliding motility-associated-like protein